MEWTSAIPSPLLPTGEDAWLDALREAGAPRAPSVIGDYEVLGELRGGQGLVLYARSRSTGQRVALKRLASEALSTPEELRRFEREVELAAGLSHPGIVTVHGVERFGGSRLLSMEWVDGIPFGSWASELRNSRSGVRHVLEVFLDLCDAVQYAHRQGVIHRDLKPSNILVDVEGRPRVVDFGAARRLDVDVSGSGDTRTLGYVGTPAYSSPECFTEGVAPVDVRSDVWSLGVVLYEALTGSLPFESSTLAELLDALRDPTPPPRVRHRVRSLGLLGPDVDVILGKALAKEADARYQTVDALAEDLRRALGGRPLLATGPTAFDGAHRWVRRNPLSAVLLGALGILLLSSAVVWWGFTQDLTEQRDLARAAGDAAREAQADAESSLAEAEVARAGLRLALDSERQASQRERRLRDFVYDCLFDPFISGSPEDREATLPLIAALGERAPEDLADDPYLVAEVLTKTASAQAWLQDWAAVRELAEEALEYEPLLLEGSLDVLGDLKSQLGIAILMQGDSQEATLVLEDAVRHYRDMPAELRSTRPGGFAEALVHKGWAHSFGGETEPAQEAFSEALEVLEDTQEDLAAYIRLRARARDGLAHLALEGDRVDEALELVTKSTDEVVSALGEEDACLVSLASRRLDIAFVTRDHELMVSALADTLRRLNRNHPGELPNYVASGFTVLDLVEEAGRLDLAQRVLEQLSSYDLTPSHAAEVARRRAALVDG